MIVKYRLDEVDRKVKSFKEQPDHIVYSAKFIGGSPVLPRLGDEVTFHNVPGDAGGKPALLDFTCEVIGRAEHHMYSNEKPVERDEEIRVTIPVKLLRVDVLEEEAR